MKGGWTDKSTVGGTIRWIWGNTHMNASPDLLMALPVLVLIAALLVAALSDAVSYTIPNRCPLLIIAAFAVHSIGVAPTATVYALLTATAVFAAGLFLFARGWLGGGDVKLIGAVALWAGPDLLPLFLMTSALAGGTVALLYLSPLRHHLPHASGIAADASDLSLLRQPVPFGLAIAVGGTVIATRLLA
jgi:prepilin peptidase CpaA